MGSLLRVETDLRRLKWLLAARRVEITFAKFAILWRKAGFNPDQPRDELGRWTNTGGSTFVAQPAKKPEAGINDSRVLSDATPDNDWKPGAQYAQNAPRGPGRSGPLPSGTPAQQTRLAALQVEADQAIARVREYDANWQPQPSLRSSDSIEGRIAEEQGRLAEAQARLDQLRTRIGGNLGPPLDPTPRPGSTVPSSRPFDGPALTANYRAIYNTRDLFGNPTWDDDEDTVAVTEFNGLTVFGVNSGAPGYETGDRLKAGEWRWALINEDPKALASGNIGYIPYDSLYHAEATVLIRSAERNGGTLADAILEVYVDKKMCTRCEQVLPNLGLKLGNPVVTFVDSFGTRKTMWNGRWLEETAK